nr:DUF4138 domain-containing protein [uncultured Sediminibacterium sp.]
MKKWILFGLLIIWAWVSEAQHLSPIQQLAVAVNRTTNLIFPAAIVSIDRGSANIIVQKSTDFVLRVKADTVFTDTTNLTVITSDGKLYSFLVLFSPSPNQLTMNLGAGEPLDKDTSLMAVVRKVQPLRHNLYGIRYSAGKVKLAVVGMYSTGFMLALQVCITNHSSLSFTVGKLRLRLVTTNTPRRSPVQEVEVVPLLVEPTALKVNYKQAGLFTVLVPVSDMNARQDLHITVHEQNGDRHLRVSIANRFLFTAPIIP